MVGYFVHVFNVKKGETVSTQKTIVINIISACAVITFAVLYIVTDSFIFKAFASISFAAAGIINFILTRNRLKEYRFFSVMLLCGLITAMIGDIVINHIFLAGAAIFAAAHIFFLLAQFRLCPPDKRSIKRDIICGAAIFLINMSILLFAPPQFRNWTTIAVCVIYAAVISAMIGKAISNCVGMKTTFSKYMLLGTGLFLLSDTLLVIYGFMENFTLIHTISISVYYISEIILADSYLMLAKD